MKRAKADPDALSSTEKDEERDFEEILAENIRLRQELVEKEEKLVCTTRLLDEIVEKQETRQRDYSTLPLCDRYAEAEANPELEAYFMEHPVKNVHVKISLKEENYSVYIRIKYCRHYYVEMFRIPPGLKDLVKLDLKSSIGCECSFCNEQDWDLGTGEQRGVVRVRYLKYDPDNMATVFRTLRLVETAIFNFKSSPVCGLVDLVFPTGQLQQQSELRVSYHLEDGARPPRNQIVNVARWARWFDFARPKVFKVSTGFGKDVPGSTPNHFHWDRGPTVYIPKNFLDIPSVHNAKEVHFYACKVDVNYRQLVALKANEILLNETKSPLLTPTDMLQFYQLKIREWMCEPTTKMRFDFGSAETCPNPPYFDWERLLADVREDLDKAEFRVYPDFLFYCNKPGYSKDTITIRCMKTRHWIAIGKFGLLTSDPRTDRRLRKETHAWPDTHGL